MTEKKFYLVIAKCGHVGRDKYFRGEFFMKEVSKKAAAARARQIPRVKHDHPDAILDVVEIDCDEYLTGVKEISKCPYYKCKSRHEQIECWEEIKDHVFPETRPVRRDTRRKNGVNSWKAYKRVSNPTVREYESYYMEMTESLAV